MPERKEFLLAPQGRLYTKGEDWVILEDNIATVGITDFAQHRLTPISFAKFLFRVGEMATKGKDIIEFDTEKANVPTESPLSGEVVDINEEVLVTPELLNEKPYDNWVYKLKLTNPLELKDFLSADAYNFQLKELH